METLVLKCQEASTTDKLNTEKATYTEGGGNSKLFLYGFRIFYVVGKPGLETVGKLVLIFSFIILLRCFSPVSET